MSGDGKAISVLSDNDEGERFQANELEWLTSSTRFSIESLGIFGRDVEDACLKKLKTFELVFGGVGSGAIIYGM